MKKKILAIALVAICASLAAYGTLAYFTHEDTATNVITAGDIQIELEEYSMKQDGTLAPFEEIDDVMPGMQVSQIVQIKNIGDHDAYVRVSVSKAIELAEGVEGEIDTSLVALNINTEYWTEQDGYYYYNDVLIAGETTEPLFTTVSFAKYMSNIYQHSKAFVDIYAQAVQTANNGSTVFEAAGWPKAE